MADLVLKVADLDVFYGSSQILFGLSLEVRKGETLALLGRNGAGKSTTMKAIAGVIPSRRGKLGCMDIRSWARARIGSPVRGSAMCPRTGRSFPI